MVVQSDDEYGARLRSFSGAHLFERGLRTKVGDGGIGGATATVELGEKGKVTASRVLLLGWVSLFFRKGAGPGTIVIAGPDVDLRMPFDAVEKSDARLFAEAINVAATKLGTGA